MNLSLFFLDHVSHIFLISFISSYTILFFERGQKFVQFSLTKSLFVRKGTSHFRGRFLNSETSETEVRHIVDLLFWPLCPDFLFVLCWVGPCIDQSYLLWGNSFLAGHHRVVFYEEVYRDIVQFGLYCSYRSYWWFSYSIDCSDSTLSYVLSIFLI